MTIHTFYRLAVWLPLAVPAAVALLVHGLNIANPGGPLQKIVQVPGPFAAVGVLGGLASIVLGYTYVSIVLLLRGELPPQSA